MIIGFDFDGTLTEKSEFPKIGKPDLDMILLCKRAQKLGIETILWTCRVEKQLEEALEFCNDYGLEFSAINECAPSNIKEFESVYKEKPRKIYCDYYIDDKNIGYCRECTIENLERILNEYEMEVMMNDLFNKSKV